MKKWSQGLLIDAQSLFLEGKESGLESDLHFEFQKTIISFEALEAIVEATFERLASRQKAAV
ncbi:hypothetical protein IH779_02295 [Patescibacteria group bacterium]|nr:hypothetical protein [Patescibacteria group bacterium]